ncbi:Proteophosphoglycan ppg4 [Rhodotorula toruloides]|nr:Proteophosphoglycan ppg4 [Rhodotorula toruloides]
MTSPSAPMDASKLPRTTINDLPTEVKTRIAEYCDEQDERATKWLTRLSLLLSAGPIELRGRLEHTLAETADRYERSIGRLFCLSKEWSQIAAPFRFKNLSTLRMNDPVFQYVVGPLRSQHFTTLALETTPNEQSVAVLLANLALRDLKEVKIDGVWFKNVVDTSYTVKPFSRALLGKLISKTEFLHLSAVDSIHVEELVKQTPSLRRLRLALDASFIRSRTVLSRVLAACPHLEELDFVSITEGGFDFTPVLAARQDIRDNWPALSSLSYEGDISGSFLAFAECFGNSLQHLTIHARAFEDFDDGPQLVNECFPRLTKLTLQGSDASSVPIPDSLRPRHAPQLRTVVYEESERNCGIDGYSIILSNIDQFRGDLSLSTAAFTFHIHLAYDVWLAEDYQSFAEYSKSSGLAVCLSCDDGLSCGDGPSFGWRGDWGEHACNESPDSFTAQQLRRDVERTLQYLSDSRDEAERSNNVEDWARLSELLKSAEFERRGPHFDMPKLQLAFFPSPSPTTTFCRLTLPVLAITLACLGRTDSTLPIFFLRNARSRSSIVSPAPGLFEPSNDGSIALLRPLRCLVASCTSRDIREHPKQPRTSPKRLLLHAHLLIFSQRPAMLDPSTTPAQRTPRVTIDALPTEVKTRIVEFCHEQDERMRRWIERLSDFDLNWPQYKPIRQKTVREHPSTVGVLFGMSKTWSAIAAPFRFKTLSASKMESSIFSHFVGPRRSQHFNKLRLDPCQNYPVITALLPSLNLSNITDLTIDGAWYTASIGAYGDYDPWSFVVRQSNYAALPVAALLRQINTLRLVHVRPVEFCRMMPHVPRLTTLHITTSRADGLQPRLGGMLVELPHLHDLHLTCESSARTEREPFNFQLVIRDTQQHTLLPQLRRFSYSGEVSATSVVFAALFSKTLEELTIDAVHDDGENEGPSLGDDCFAALTHLKLAGSWLSSWPILESLSPGRTPKLRSLTYEAHECVGGIEEEHRGILNMVNHFCKTARLAPHEFAFHLHLRNDIWSAADRDFAAAYSAKHKNLPICLSCDEHLPSFGWSDPCEPPLEQLDSAPLAREIREDVQRTLRFVEDLGRQLEASGTPADWSRAAELLRAAEFERSAMAM